MRRRQLVRRARIGETLDSRSDALSLEAIEGRCVPTAEAP
jgi:hypothetical protein